MIALVLLVIFDSKFVGDIDPVVASISTHTGCAPKFIIGVFVAMQVIAVVKTSSPGPTPQIFKAKVIALVHEFVKIKLSIYR